MRRYWRRSDETRSGAWLPLLGLILAFLYGLLVTAPAIEAQTTEQVRLALLDNDLADFSLEGDGQRVLVSAIGTEADAARILDWAGGAACDTWIAEQLTCPTNVRVEVTAPAPVVVEPEPEPEPEPAPVPVERFHDFDFRRTGDSIVLSGEVPSETDRVAIVAQANIRFETVTDGLIISGDPATEGYRWAADRALPILAAATDSEATWNDGLFSVSATVAATDEQSIRRAFASDDYPARLGELNLEVIDEAAVCNEQFTSALSSAAIRFQTGSATISPDSEDLIEQLSQLAQDCPGSFAVDGHTDSTGSAILNRNLSLARAQAVVAALTAAGVEAGRLTARGFGADQPVADNATDSGRIQNRRIEIQIIDPQAEQ
jgi:outer membrane protein OmpA-like peptidoglycan-associated protein